MANPFENKSVGSINAEAVGTNAGATATIAAQTKNRVVPTHITASGDAAALVTLSWTEGGVAKTWKKRFAAAFQTEENFDSGEIIGDVNTAVTCAISASTANCEVNLAGLLIPGSN